MRGIFDPDELEFMDPDERREVLEDAALDPDEYDFQEEQIMSKKDGYSRKSLFGGINHYDNKGHKTGHSNRGILGDWHHYDD